MPGVDLVLVADRGKEHQCQEIAAALPAPAGWVEMPEGTPQNSDINDLAGADPDSTEARRVLNDIRRPPQRFVLLSASELAARPPDPWLVKEVLPQDGIAVLFGSSATGKSFLGIDMLACIADGRSWFGHEVEQAPVVYLALEGAAGIPQRVRAHCQRHGDMAVRFIIASIDLRQSADRTALAASIKAAGLAGGVLCIDTLAASAPGLDENSSVDMGEYIGAIKGLQADLGGLVLVVHHCGKEATKGPRGHSSLFAAMDAAVEVTRTDDRREWRVAKSKDGEDGKSHSFRLEVVALGADRASCVVMPDEQLAETVRRVKVPAGGNQRLIYNAICELLRQGDRLGMGGAPPTRPCIRLEDAIERTRDLLACDPDQRKYRTQLAITSLAGKGAIELRQDWIWLP